MRVFITILTMLVFSVEAFAADPVYLKPIVYQQFQAVKMVPINPIYANMKFIKPVLPETTAKPTGPDPQASIDLSDIIDDPALISDLGAACGFDPHLIFQDKSASNVFYYLPRVILLTYDKSGYGLSVQYNNQTEQGAPAVMVTAVVAAPFRQGDTKVLKAILRDALGLKPTDKLTLNALPGIGSSADMNSLTAGLSLPAERIHLTAPAHLRQSFRMTLSLTQDETEELLAQIGREGLAGSLYVPVGDALVPVPILIKYSEFSEDPVKGFQQWADGDTIEEIENISIFPVQLTSINGYRLKGNKLERVSKKLKNSPPIAPKSSKKFKLPPASTLLGNNLVVTWLGVDLDNSCETCIAKADQEIRQGVGAAPGEKVKFEAIPSIFSEFGLYKVIVQVQSPFFTAEAKKVEKKEFELTADENIDESVQLHVPQDKGSGSLLYRYKLVLISENGESFSDTEWRDGKSLSNYVGSSQIETLMPEPQ